MNTQTSQSENKTVVFDEHGNTIAEEIETAPEEIQNDEVPNDSDESEVIEPQAPAGKYRIGDKTFATAEEALAFAESQVSTLETENQIADAYRQGLKDAISQGSPAAESVTPPHPVTPSMDTEELYTNPQSFLEKYATRIKTEARQEIDARDSMKAQSDQIWREFVDRHPALSDFRGEIEDFVAKHTTEVRAIIGTKGRPASYDWIATKLKSRFEAYANAVKPKRTLPNGSQGASPSSKAAGVTPSAPPKKALSFSEQLRSIRKRR